MESKQSVEQRLADSFQRLAVQMPVEKITIKEITDDAGFIRPTFYNHFQDKYDLLEWIIRTEVIDPIIPILQNGYVEEGLVQIFKNALKSKEFFIKTSKMDGQNSLESIIRKCIKEILLNFILSRSERKKFTYAWMTPDMIAEYYAQSMTFVVMTWIRRDMVVPPEEMAKVYQYIVHRSMDDVINEMLFDNTNS
jgi:probable dihydroxyacetone kinase regulator